MATILFVREGASPGNIYSIKDTSVHDVIEEFGDNPKGYVKKPLSDNPTINKDCGPANSLTPPQHIIIKIQNEDIFPSTFPEAGCYLVKDIVPKI